MSEEVFIDFWLPPNRQQAGEAYGCTIRLGGNLKVARSYINQMKAEGWEGAYDRIPVDAIVEDEPVGGNG